VSLRARLVGILGALVIVAGGIVAVPASPATALSGADFNPGLIISDEVFFNANTMTRDQIQAFLDAKGGTCQSGYTCLADYTQTTFTRAADSTCASYTGAANETAASIIFKVAKACGINPQVLLVTLQKEMSLITRTSPTSWSYKIAMGYGCPDTAPCDERFYGFYNQVYLAGRQLVRYGEFPDYYNWFPIGVATNVRYHPKEACGTKRVTIQSRATAALYYYTPYTPNAAALANLTSTGDACSSYGNRNFWRFFNAWFGSPVLPQTHINYVSPCTTTFWAAPRARASTRAGCGPSSRACPASRSRTASSTRPSTGCARSMRRTAPCSTASPTRAGGPAGSRVSVAAS